MQEINLIYPKIIFHKGNPRAQNRQARKDWAERRYYDDNRECEYCGITESEYRSLMSEGDHVQTLTKDHVIPKTFGGKTTVWACIKCNLSKNHTFTYEEFKIIGKEIIRPLWIKIYEKRYGNNEEMREMNSGVCA